MDEVDTLSGGAGADRFNLGLKDANLVFYIGNGNSYAIITDFSSQQGDKIGFFGSLSNYALVQNSNVSGGSALDTQIFYQNDLIAIVQDTTTVSLSSDFV